MSSTITTYNEHAANYIATKDAVTGPRLTCSFACDGGGKNYHLHSKRFRNALRDMRKEAENSEEDREALDAVLDRAEALAGDKEKWSGEYQGICIHVSQDTADLIRLQYAPPEVTTVGDAFAYRPAADALPTQLELLVLHLSFKSPQLFLYTGGEARLFGAIELPESVYSFSEETALDREQHAHVRTGNRNRDAAPSTVNQSFASEESPRDLNEPVFLKEVGRALQKLEESKALPLVVIGDDKLVSEFLTHYDHPSGKVVQAPRNNPHPSDADIEQVCTELTVQLQRDAKAEVLKSLKEVDPNSERFNDNVKEVFEAAQQARIKACVIAADEYAWCRYDENGALSSANPEQDDDCFEVMDRIYAETAMKGGEVAVVPKSKVPGEKSVAAIFKW